MNRAIRTVILASGLGALTAACVGCEMLVELDRSAVDASPTVCSICSNAEDIGDGGGDGPDDATSDTSRADAGADASSADSGADTASE
jgi:hypothetical protein